MSNNKKAQYTVERVYLTSKPISINSPSLPEPVTQSSEDDGFTREYFGHALKKASRAVKARRIAKRNRT